MKRYKRIEIMELIKAHNGEPVLWLWGNKIRQREFTVIAGNKSIGRSHMMIELAAIVSKKESFPDGWATDKNKVVFFSDEDNYSAMLRPKLLAAGADLKNITIYNKLKDGFTTYNIKKNFETLARKVEDLYNVDAIFIDPFSEYVQPEDMIFVIEELKAFAYRMSLSVICSVDFNQDNVQPLMKAATSVHLITQHHGEKRVFIPIKNEFGNKNGFEFEIERVDLGHDIKTTRIKWLNEIIGDQNV